ncbi:hypothetical protein [Sphingomonas sp. PP-CE-1G-424]|uniref:hypothetical protein n=1 Tax=Sphingomonas sp. PP-CE-1G-424 TaxID=2135658 RepID=UPI00140487ED|nr:hypothetical protein [Sphingomonas sp. PP-CE-1G-424]
MLTAMPDSPSALRAFTARADAFDDDNHDNIISPNATTSANARSQLSSVAQNDEHPGPQ